MKYLSIILLCFFFLGCSNEDSAVEKDATIVAEENETAIMNYLSQNKITATKSSSGLYYAIQNPGSGSFPNRNSQVTVAYKGYYTNGKTFDESSAAGISFSLSQVIPGWTEGITYFRQGGKGQLFIPAALGYGLNNYNGIPGGSVLIFDINLIAVQN